MGLQQPYVAAFLKVWSSWCSANPQRTLKVDEGSGSVGQAHMVPDKFECWPLGVNATPYKALAT